MTFDEPWYEHALCNQVDPELFYPTNGGVGAEQSRRAKNICRKCPLRSPDMRGAPPGGTGECLDYALKHHDLFGIWGGLTPKEREAVRRKRRNEAA